MDIVADVIDTGLYGGGKKPKDLGNALYELKEEKRRGANYTSETMTFYVSAPASFTYAAACPLLPDAQTLTRTRLNPSRPDELLVLLRVAMPALPERLCGGEQCEEAGLLPEPVPGVHPPKV